MKKLIYFLIALSVLFSFSCEKKEGTGGTSSIKGKVKVRDVLDNEMKSIDPSGLCFWNVNTPEEFAKAEALAKSDSHL